jgi:hypothetical protein
MVGGTLTLTKDLQKFGVDVYGHAPTLLVYTYNNRLDTGPFVTVLASRLPTSFQLCSCILSDRATVRPLTKTRPALILHFDAWTFPVPGLESKRPLGTFDTVHLPPASVRWPCGRQVSLLQFPSTQGLSGHLIMCMIQLSPLPAF